jgi:hypothetical protein
MVVSHGPRFLIEGDNTNACLLWFALLNCFVKFCQIYSFDRTKYYCNASYLLSGSAAAAPRAFQAAAALGALRITAIIVSLLKQISSGIVSSKQTKDEMADVEAVIARVDNLKDDPVARASIRLEVTASVRCNETQTIPKFFRYVSYFVLNVHVVLTTLCSYIEENIGPDLEGAMRADIPVEVDGINLFNFKQCVFSFLAKFWSSASLTIGLLLQTFHYRMGNLADMVLTY